MKIKGKATIMTFICLFLLAGNSMGCNQYTGENCGETANASFWNQLRIKESGGSGTEENGSFFSVQGKAMNAGEGEKVAGSVTEEWEAKFTSNVNDPDKKTLTSTGYATLKLEAVNQSELASSYEGKIKGQVEQGTSSFQGGSQGNFAAGWSYSGAKFGASGDSSKISGSGTADGYSVTWSTDQQYFKLYGGETSSAAESWVSQGGYQCNYGAGEIASSVFMGNQNGFASGQGYAGYDYSSTNPMKGAAKTESQTSFWSNGNSANGFAKVESSASTSKK